MVRLTDLLDVLTICTNDATRQADVLVRVRIDNPAGVLEVTGYVAAAAPEHVAPGGPSPYRIVIDAIA